MGTPTSIATSNTVEGQNYSADTSAEAFGGLLSNDVNQVSHSLVPPPLPRRHGKARYYSVIVGKCCGVYFSW
jgi:hypothetical protein